jgi:uncharacterized protein (TIGR02001 family)
MTTLRSKFLLGSTLGMTALGGVTIAAPAAAEVTGNIGVVSQYIFRGYVEDDRTSLQGGLDYAHDSGFYAGTWWSTLSYGASNNNEVDLYAGYAGEAGDFGYDVGVLYFYYTGDGDGDEDGNVPELYAAGSVGPFSLSANYAADDATWTNEGDIYLNAGYSADLPNDFGFGVSVGYYAYEKDGEFLPETADSSSGALRDTTISLTHPLGDAEMSVNYMIGGEDRDGSDIDDALWYGATWSF